MNLKDLISRRCWSARRGSVLPRSSSAANEEGFTLIELLVVVLILPMVIGAVAVVVITGFKATDSHDPEGTAARLADSHDAQITSAYFVRDVESAQFVTTLTSSSVCGSGSQILGLQWIHDETAPPVTVSVSYAVSASSPYTLIRRYCQGTTPESDSVVSSDLFEIPQFTGLEAISTPVLPPPTVGNSGCPLSGNSCASENSVNDAWITVNCVGGGPTGCGSTTGPVAVYPASPNPGIQTVQLTIHEANSGFTYTLTGTPRQTSLVSTTPPCTTTSNPPCLPSPPLLLLGTGAKVVGCVGSNGAVTVNGAIAVDSSTNGSVNMQNSTLTAQSLYSTDTSDPSGAYTGNNPGPAQESAGPPVPDPYETALPYDGDAQGAQAAEPIPASAPSAPNPNGNTYNPGSYPSGLSISGNGTYTFSSGVYVFGGSGLSVTGGANIVSGAGGVLFYADHGGISLTGGGNVNLTALPSTSGFDNVVIWDSELDPSPGVSLGGNGSIVNVNGVIYAPTGTVSTGGNGAISTGTIVANKLACNGNGATTISGAGTGVSVVTTPGSSTVVVNNAIADSATVVGNPNGPAPTGTVTFYYCSPTVLTAHSATTCSNTFGTEIPGTGGNPDPATLSGASTSSSTASSPTITPNATGTWCFAGYYSGDSNYPTANDSSFDECFAVTATAGAPYGFSIASTPNPKNGTPDSGDKVIFTYSTLMSASSIKTGWNGSSTAVTVNFSHCQGNSSPDCLSVTNVNLGTVNLEGSYVAQGNNKSYTIAANMVMSTNGSNQSVITITLTGTSMSAQQDMNPYSMVWTPSASATDTSNNPCSTTPVTETGAAENF